MSLSRRKFLRGLAYGFTGAVCTGAYADYSAHAPQLEQVDLTLKGWKADGLRVAFLTDLHVNDPDDMVRAQVASRMVVDASPDIVLFGGDYVNSDKQDALENISLGFEPLDKLRCPKIAVLGNHDYWTNAPPKIEARLSGCGIRLLKNEVIKVDGYHVAGYDDRIGGVRDENFQPTDPSTIVLMHEPDDVEFVPETACLQLSGHSHGGQICFPFGVPYMTPKLSRKYRKGYFPDAKVPLYVSRGVGTTGFKWRLFCPPEVTILTLRSAR